MKNILPVLIFSFSASLLFAQKKPAYCLFNSKGKKITYGKMLRQLQKKDIILFGEFHNNPVSHWLELEVTKDCHKTRNLLLGAEMFEQDNQESLNQYLAGKLDAKGLDSSARLWKNYHTDYAPLVDYAKENNISFAATNIPRRYASLVAKGGFENLDTLSPEAKSWIAPLPVPYDASLPGYKKMKDMIPGHSGENLPKAQAIKDATMAHFILSSYKPGSLFIHFNGAYHSENYEGILWYLRKEQPSLKYATITTVSQQHPEKLLPENKKKADFIICADEDMTTTY
jgi:uncharacterized iron-regulated protein